MTRFITRFAPSPTGYLHLGHVGSAFAVWDAAASAGGRVILRLEDIDQTRCRPEYETAVYEDLAWLGLTWDAPVRRQSDHFEDYAHILEVLRARSLIYRCFRTRKEVLADIGRAPHSAPSAFIGTALPADEEAERIGRGEAFAWRLSLAHARDTLGTAFDGLCYEESGIGSVRIDVSAFGDVVLARKDTPASYHLASTHDDALQKVTHIVRGEDLRASTSIHVLLQTLMGWPVPIYRHHSLLYDETGKRFAKRDKSRTVRAMKADGMTPQDLRRLAGGL